MKRRGPSSRKRTGWARKWRPMPSGATELRPRFEPAWTPSTTVTVDQNLATHYGGEFWKKTFDLQRENFSKAMKKGVKIALGTDAGGFDWKKINQAKEFEYYVQYGMTPMQAIHAGTSVPAELLGWSDKVGTIEAGKWADIAAVAGDPLRDITELQRVVFVMKGGAVYRNEVR